MKDLYKEQAIIDLSNAITWLSHVSFDERHEMYEECEQNFRRAIENIKNALDNIERYKKEVLPF